MDEDMIRGRELNRYLDGQFERPAPSPEDKADHQREDTSDARD